MSRFFTHDTADSDSFHFDGLCGNFDGTPTNDISIGGMTADVENFVSHYKTTVGGIDICLPVPYVEPESDCPVRAFAFDLALVFRNKGQRLNTPLFRRIIPKKACGPKLSATVSCTATFSPDVESRWVWSWTRS